MPEPVGWIKSGETGESFVSMLVIRHRDGISTEGAFHQRRTAEAALDQLGLEVAGATTGIDSSTEAAMRAVRGFWGMRDA